jgi:hypothetical protein
MHRAGSSLADVVRARAWFTDGDAIEPIRATHPVLFDDPGPALSVIGVPNLPNGVKVMLELEAVIGSGARLQRYMPQEGQGWSHESRLAGPTRRSTITVVPFALAPTSWAAQTNS